MAPAPAAPSPAASPSIPSLFAGFLGVVGLMGFGGVLPLARRMIVEQRGWLSGPEFADLLALCQFLPGGNIINVSVAVGLRFRGLPGACASIFGLLSAPVAVAILLGGIYERYRDVAAVRHLFAGLAAAAAGLVAATAIKIAWPLLRRPLPQAIAGGAVALACFVAVALLRWPLLATMSALAPLSILLAWPLTPKLPGSGGR